MFQEALNHKGITTYMEYLDRQLQRCAMYENLNNIAEGKFLIDELKSRREMARNLYACIDVSSDKAIVTLAAYQNCERESTEWLNRITNVSEMRKTLQSELDQLQKVAEQRKKVESESQFIPSSRRAK